VLERTVGSLTIADQFDDDSQADADNNANEYEHRPVPVDRCLRNTQHTTT